MIKETRQYSLGPLLVHVCMYHMEKLEYPLEYHRTASLVGLYSIIEPLFCLISIQSTWELLVSEKSYHHLLPILRGGSKHCVLKIDFISWFHSTASSQDEKEIWQIPFIQMSRDIHLISLTKVAFYIRYISGKNTEKKNVWLRLAD